jgi:hypothetical protein
MLKVLPEPKRETREDIQSFFKARNITFETSALKKELYRQLGLSELLEPIKSVSDMAHKKRNLNFTLILKTDNWCLKYQYLDLEIKLIDGAFKVVEIDKLKKGFYKFNGDEICSFLEYCIEDEIEFQILSSKSIDKNLLISKIKK